jgi:O-antigen/teichoic acid export membrane protein
MVGGIKGTLRPLVHLALGEAGSRVASFILLAYISRRFGVEVLGIVALAQTVASYVTLGSDQGLRLIGARLVARDAGSARIVARQLLRKRLLLATFSIAAGTLYALFGPLPVQARPYVLCFVLAVLPYAFSLDWLAWGLNEMGWLGGWRAGVSAAFAIGTVAGIHFSGNAFASITIANGASTTLGAIFLLIVWRAVWSHRTQRVDYDAKAQAQIVSDLKWAPVMTLGIAAILNLMFTNFDTVMLGAMSTAAEVGRYNAASKILFLIFGAYYLLTQTLYPQLSRAPGGITLRNLVLRMLLGVSATGIVIAVIVRMSAPTILRVIYGSDLNAVGLLRILSIAVPMNFCTALLGTVFVSRGQDRIVLITGATSAVLNISMNLFLIPRMQAQGAAWATVASYVVFLAMLITFFWRVVRSQPDRTVVQQPEAVLAR